MSDQLEKNLRVNLTDDDMIACKACGALLFIEGGNFFKFKPPIVGSGYSVAKKPSPPVLICAICHQIQPSNIDDLKTLREIQRIPRATVSGN